MPVFGREEGDFRDFPRFANRGNGVIDTGVLVFQQIQRHGHVEIGMDVRHYQRILFFLNAADFKISRMDDGLIW